MAQTATMSRACLDKAAVQRSAFTGQRVCGRPFRPVAVTRPFTAQCRAAAAAPEAPAVPVFKGDLFNKSYYPTGADAQAKNKRWYIIDAKGQTLGRLATLAATYIRGKNMATYTPSMDMGAYVIVINADQIEVSGRKAETKGYFHHLNGRPGSWRIEKFQDLKKRIPERIIERAVHGMLPKGRLGRRIKLHLKVFNTPAHPHEAQQPEDITHMIDIKPSGAPLNVKA